MAFSGKGLEQGQRSSSDNDDSIERVGKIKVTGSVLHPSEITHSGEIMPESPTLQETRLVCRLEVKPNQTSSTDALLCFGERATNLGDSEAFTCGSL